MAEQSLNRVKQLNLTIPFKRARRELGDAQSPTTKEA